MSRDALHPMESLVHESSGPAECGVQTRELFNDGVPALCACRLLYLRLTLTCEKGYFQQAQKGLKNVVRFAGPSEIGVRQPFVPENLAQPG
jgi:hypothetical protein